MSESHSDVVEHSVTLSSCVNGIVIAKKVRHQD